ncbi:Surfactin synthase thioesterase subunit [Streptomyces sp. cf386]|uniref:thioesterase II family protein n=1 Tax=Streptomyces sp. cf386 TaxID=1761904 RepID=UPI000890CAB3|nr:alpha/beta fold hydrolase [Streptomyces sp. cf386]SDP81169.1 Surfactin synthase thioesterase subunit [Streptomyces sp. cf386]
MFRTTANTGTNPTTGTPTRGEVTRLRLFCFHHAGGSAWSFAGWGHRLGSGVEVVPVPMPPRSAPTAGAPGVPGAVSTMDALVDEVTRQLAPALDRPYAFYGHSMGSLVAHGVAQRQLAAGRRAPACFVAGAHRAPHLPPAPALEVAPSDEAALDLLLGLGGAGRLLRENPARMRAVVDQLREDLRVCGTHRRPPSGHRPLPCPLHVMIGDRDPLVTVADAEAWRVHTSARFALHTLPGGHFFVREQKDLFFEELRRALGAVEA